MNNKSIKEGLTAVILFVRIKIIITKALHKTMTHLLFFSVAAFPLTWERQDRHAYNKEMILKNVPEGSKILTDVKFWRILDKDYEIFDLHFGNTNIHKWDYVLPVSGGGGRPKVAPLYLSQKVVPYFHKHFAEVSTTMSNEPNKLFRFPVSRSRWCYRFQLYKRKK